MTRQAMRAWKADPLIAGEKSPFHQLPFCTGAGAESSLVEKPVAVEKFFWGRFDSKVRS